MLIVTAGDHRFREMILASQRQAAAFGYRFQAYDLGGLGFGEEYNFDLAAAGFQLGLAGSGSPSQERFARDGIYSELEAGRFTRALHKPWMVQQHLNGATDFIVYLDGDAMLLSSIDEVVSDDYDVGLVLRADGDISFSPHTSGQINAGVMFLANSDGARIFVDLWTRETRQARNDQVALNNLVGLGNAGWQAAQRRRWWQRHRPTKWVFNTSGIPRELNVDGVRFRLFDFTYNCFAAPLPPAAKIAHFKGPQKARFDEFRLLCQRLNYVAA